MKRQNMHSKRRSKSNHWLAFVFAFAIVCYGFVLRWNDVSHKPGETHISLANPEIAEAAFLFQNGFAQVKEVTDSRLVYLTKHIALPDVEGELSAAMINAGESFAEYSVDRVELENTLGRNFSEDDIVPKADSHQVFYQRSRLVSYIFLETVGLGAFLVLFLLGARRIGLQIWLAPYVTASVSIGLLAVRLYSPSFYSVDTIISRVAVDSVALGFVRIFDIIFWTGICAGLCGLCLSFPKASKFSRQAAAFGVVLVFALTSYVVRKDAVNLQALPGFFTTLVNAHERVIARILTPSFSGDSFAQRQK